MHNLHASIGKRLAFVLVLAVTTLTGRAVSAQDVTAGWDPRSGDTWVDTWLGDMNRYGARYPEPFIDEMVRYHNAPRVLVVDLLQTRHWTPGDVYYACAMATVLGRPCRYVVDLYEADRGQGWGVVAQRLGIEPGSPEFHRLKKGFVPTYDRWARPIDLDDDLRRAYPDRSKGKPVSRSKSATDKPAAVGPDARGGKPEAKGAQKGSAKGNAKGNGKGSGKDNGKGNSKGDKGSGKDNGKGNSKGDKGNGKGNSKG